MARRNVVAKSSLVLTNPYYTDISDAIDDLADAEDQFYDDRRDELNSYPGLSGLSSNDVEEAYDSLLGERPWNYTSIFNNAGNSLSTETDDTVDDDGNDEDQFYVRIPSSLDSLSDLVDDFGRHYHLYNPGVGNRVIDLLYTDISFFEDGSSGSGNDENDNPFSYRTGFGEVPIAYQSNSQLSGRLAHMYRLIGALYDTAVDSKYSAYISAKNNYEGSTGSGNDADFFSGTQDKPWDGFTGDTTVGYNRPDKLKGKLVRETRGAN
tara:strand:+ start:707 stop:1501 length:795 start_codon:yes stop_codon:yes gene_type:complete